MQLGIAGRQEIVKIAGLCFRVINSTGLPAGKVLRVRYKDTRAQQALAPERLKILALSKSGGAIVV